MKCAQWLWRHIKMLKCAGRGHDPDGVKATQMGECAVECPACPHPKKNLPDGWKNAPESILWVLLAPHQTHDSDSVFQMALYLPCNHWHQFPAQVKGPGLEGWSAFRWWVESYGQDRTVQSVHWPIWPSSPGMLYWRVLPTCFANYLIYSLPLVILSFERPTTPPWGHQRPSRLAVWLAYFAGTMNLYSKMAWEISRRENGALAEASCIFIHLPAV